MRSSDENEPSPRLEWIEDAEAIDEALRDVVISHEGGNEPDGDDDNGHNGDNGADGESSHRRRGRAA